MTTLYRPSTPALKKAALTFAQANEKWRRLSALPRSWSEADRRRTLAAAFLDFHAAKLAVVEITGYDP